MKNIINTIRGSKISNLITKFYYKENELRFMILLQSGGEVIPYQDFNNYGDYKSAFNKVLEAKTNDFLLSLGGAKVGEGNRHLKIA